MEFTLNLESANTLYRFAKAYIDPRCLQTNFKTIACRIEDGMLTATMLDTTKACLLKLHVDCNENGTCFIAPPMKSFKKSDVFVKVEDSDKETAYKTAVGSQTYRKPDLHEPQILDINKLMTDPIECVWIEAEKLATALSAFNGIVKMDYIGRLNGLVLSDPFHKAIVLPVNPPKGE